MMFLVRTATFVILCSALTFAAEPAGFSVWKGSDVKNMEKQLSSKGKLGMQAMGDFGNHRLSTIRRTESGQAEIHQHVADFLIIESGQATLLVGGKAPSAKQTEPGELRGPSIEGGEKRPLGPGDIVHIAPNVPHQMLLDAGKQVTYVAIKVDSATHGH